MLSGVTETVFWLTQLTEAVTGTLSWSLKVTRSPTLNSARAGTLAEGAAVRMPPAPPLSAPAPCADRLPHVARSCGAD